MKIATDPSAIWNEYQKGVRFKTSIGLFERVKQNELFYGGRQWEGVYAPDLPKPILNVIKPSVNYYVAMLISDDIRAKIELTGRDTRTDAALYAASHAEGGQAAAGYARELLQYAVSAEVENVLEAANVRFKHRQLIRNCAVDGDACFYIWYDVDESPEGEIKVELIDNTNVFFGDPTTPDVSAQPYIILAYRRLKDEVEAEAGSAVNALEEPYYCAANTGEEYATVLLKLWKQNGSIHMTKVTKDAVLSAPVNTGYSRYPVCWLNWEGVKNCCHGISPVTAAIPNQILINKLFAMQAIAVQNGAFPKILYDSSRIERWDGRPGHDVAVNGDPTMAVFSAWRAPDVSADVPKLIESAIKYTKDLMGASDAALGNVKPDNTSAIIATQKAAGLPLDIQRMDFYNFVEDCVRVFIDVMRAKYGRREVCFTDAQGARQTAGVDFSALPNSGMKLKIEIGQGAYWSELTQVRTLDNLMQLKIIPDAATYLEALPEGYIRNKQKIIDRLKETQNGGML